MIGLGGGSSCNGGGIRNIVKGVINNRKSEGFDSTWHIGKGG